MLTPKQLKAAIRWALGWTSAVLIIATIYTIVAMAAFMLTLYLTHSPVAAWASAGLAALILWAFTGRN